MYKTYYHLSYKIKGPMSDDDRFLYWSNEDGWVDIFSATRFTKEEIDSISLPCETVGIIAINKNGIIVDTITVTKEK